MNSTQMSVTTGATAMVSGTRGDVAYPASAIVKLPSTATESVYLGGPAVTTSSGYVLAAGETISVDLVNETLYGRVQTTAQTVYVLRRGD